jgi:hypothetical protein
MQRQRRPSLVSLVVLPVLLGLVTVCSSNGKSSSATTAMGGSSTSAGTTSPATTGSPASTGSGTGAQGASSGPSGTTSSSGSTGTGGSTGSGGAVNSGASVLTWRNDNARTGQYLVETTLTPANVNSTKFGKLASLPVDGYVYAQPLFVAGVKIGGATHDVVYVATEHDTLYAYDVGGGAPLWQVSFLKGGATPVPPADTGETGDLIPELGITGTPVIDAATGTLYVVVNTKEAGPTYPYRLHALDLATGAEKLGGPVDISASVPGTGGNSMGGMVVFTGLNHLQRPALLLSNGVVYVTFGSHGDHNADLYHGWVLGYGATDLKQSFVYCTTPNGTAGSIWQSGAGPAVDASGSLYLETANGDFDADMGGSSLSESVIKLGKTGLLDWFTPHDQALLDSGDVELGSVGAVVLPDQTGPVAHELLASGKPGVLYLLDRDAMGHFNAADDSQIVQVVDVNPNTTDIQGGIFATPAYWNGKVYVVGVSDTLKAFALSNGKLSTSPTSHSALTFQYPGSTPVVSSNGSSAGIVWVIEGQGYTPAAPGVLHAYDATNLANQLYDSTQAGARDTPGNAVKFTPPTVAKGKVLVASQTEVTVYGLLP